MLTDCRVGRLSLSMQKWKQTNKRRILRWDF